MTSCPTRSAAWERSLKGGLLPAHGRIRRGPEGSSRKVDVRRRWDPRVEKTARTPCLEEMPITRGRHHRLCPTLSPLQSIYSLEGQDSGCNSRYAKPGYTTGAR